MISRENCQKKNLGEKLVKMLGFCQNWIFGQKISVLNNFANYAYCEECSFVCVSCIKLSTFLDSLFFIWLLFFRFFPWSHRSSVVSFSKYWRWEEVFVPFSLPKAHETSSHKTAFNLLLHKSFLSDYSALITWLSLEATVVKNVDKIFSYFSNFSPDFKSGAQILWISFPIFLTWMIIGFLINNFFASKWKPGKIFDNYYFFQHFYPLCLQP